MIEVRIQPQGFDTAAITAALRRDRQDVGALVTFTGIVRDHPMLLEHYAALAQAELRALADEAAQRWPLLGGVIIHRYGALLPGDDIVLVAIASTHRTAAFEAAQFLMDWLKTRAPFWKSEDHGSGRAWVEAKAADDDAAARWSQAKPLLTR